MNPDELKAQLAEAIRNSSYEDATRIALDLIEQLETTIEARDKEIRMLRAKTNFRPSYDTTSDKRLYQERENEDSD